MRRSGDGFRPAVAAISNVRVESDDCRVFRLIEHHALVVVRKDLGDSYVGKEEHAFLPQLEGLSIALRRKRRRERKGLTRKPGIAIDDRYYVHGSEAGK